jgi:hypothetical protein
MSLAKFTQLMRTLAEEVSIMFGCHMFCESFSDIASAKDFP